MGTWESANRYPSITEFSGYYNIPDQYDNTGPVLRSDDRLPEFGFPELWKVYTAAVEWFAAAAPLPPPQPAFQPVFEEIFLPRCETDDRTLSIDHVDYGRLDVPFMRRIQKEFLGRFPLWRIQLVGWDGATDIVVYPTAIRFGNQPVDTDPAEALRELVPRGVALREAWLRPQRAHIAFMRQQLPGALLAIGDRPFHIFAVLDNYEGDYSRLTICLLIRGDARSAVDVDGPPGSEDDFLWCASPYYANAQGTLVPDGPEEPAFCLAMWLPPADFRGPLTLIEKATGKRHVYEVTPEAITRTSGMN